MSKPRLLLWIGMEPKDWISLLSVLIAVIALTVGPYVQIAIAKRQMDTALDAARRQSDTALAVARIQAAAPVAQAWIKDLVESLTNFIGFFHMTHERHRQSPELKVDLRGGNEITALSHKVLFLLDPADPDHFALEIEIGEMLKDVTGDSKAFHESRNKVIALARKILRQRRESLGGSNTTT